MENFYYVLFCLLSVLVGGLIYTQNKEGSIVPSSGPNVSTFLKLRNNYLFVYSMMMGEPRGEKGRRRGCSRGAADRGRVFKLA
jgi:hypothetical protein